jgi:hypothetical protein
MWHKRCLDARAALQREQHRSAELQRLLRDIRSGVPEVLSALNIGCTTTLNADARLLDGPLELGTKLDQGDLRNLPKTEQAIERSPHPDLVSGMSPHNTCGSSTSWNAWRQGVVGTGDERMNQQRHHPQLSSPVDRTSKPRPRSALATTARTYSSMHPPSPKYGEMGFAQQLVANRGHKVRAASPSQTAPFEGMPIEQHRPQPPPPGRLRPQSAPSKRHAVLCKGSATRAPLPHRVLGTGGQVGGLPSHTSSRTSWVHPQTSRLYKTEGHVMTMPGQIRGGGRGELLDVSAMLTVKRC